MKIEIGANEAGQRIDKFTRKLFKDMPLSAVYKGIRKGDIKVNGKKVKENYDLCLGDIFESDEVINVNNKKDKFIKADANIKITYEDKNMLIVEKWPGVLVHSDGKNKAPSLTDYVLTYLCERGDYTPEDELTFTPASCNRLDRNTSGVVIFGKNYNAMKILNEMVRERKIKKYYCALVTGRIKDGLYEAYISKNEDENISQIYFKEEPNTKKIAMEVKTIQSCGTYSFIDIELITGRSHQLRAHLSKLGNPIIGDTKYGDKKINNFFFNKYELYYQYLYAYKLTFKDCSTDFQYLSNKTIAESLPPVLKKIKNDIFRF